jgi:ribosome-associated heat shock protein Hsp15
VTEHEEITKDPDCMNDTPTPAGPQMGQRIDKWLWFARVIKSRTLAAECVTEGKVRLNRVRVEKPSQIVKPGDVLTIALGSRVRVFEVAAPGTRRGPAPEAQALYKDLTPPAPPRDPNALPEPSSGRDAGSGRPTKRDRRLTEKLQSNE